MLIDLEKLPVDIVPHMRDGGKEVHLKKWSDGPVKVLQGKLPAGPPSACTPTRRTAR